VTNLCSAFNQLPKEGGVFDQDSILMRSMYLVLVAQNAKSQEEMDKLNKDMSRMRAGR